jgi:ribonucleoside-triphosphate reductase
MIVRDSDVKVIKKNGNREIFTPEKIKVAITKSAIRANVELSEANKDQVVNIVIDELDDRGLKEVTVEKLHTMVESALEVVSPKTAKSYKDYRNFKAEFGKIMEEVYNDVEKIMFRGDKENANKDSSLVSTKKSLSSSSLYKEIYKETFLTDEERKLIKEGDYYIHDMSDRLNGINCCLFRMGEVLDGGFEMANIWYNEPKSLDTAFDVIADVVLSAASQQYGGFTIPQVDKLLSRYAEKSYQKYFKQSFESDYQDYLELGLDEEKARERATQKAEKFAEEKVMEEYRQGFQGWEYKFNTVSSSRGDYPFITVTSGLDTSKWGRLGNKIMYDVH